MKKFIAILSSGLLLLLPTVSLCQTPSAPWLIGVHAGISEYRGEMGNGFFDLHVTPTQFYNAEGIQIQENRPGFLGLSATRYLNDQLDVSFQIQHGEWGYFNPNKTQFFFTYYNLLSSELRYKIPGFENSAFTPYVLAGIGYRNVSVKNKSNKFQHEAVMPLGFGLNLRLTKLIVLNAQSNFGLSTGDMGDGMVKAASLSKDQFWNHSIGLCITPAALGFGHSKSLRSKCPRF